MKQWLLLVYDGAAHDRALHKIGLFPSKNHAGLYLGFYALSAKPQMLRHIEQVRELGLHGKAKQVAKRDSAPSKPHPRHRHADSGPDAKIINLMIAKENRLARDALKLATERRRQAERGAEAEISRRAHEALLRAKGEV